MALAKANDRSDQVVLRAPREKESLPIMRVFIGGLASRHSLSVDQLDDIELAVETLFREEPASGADLTLTISVEGGTFKVKVTRPGLIHYECTIHPTTMNGTIEVVR